MPDFGAQSSANSAGGGSQSSDSDDDSSSSDEDDHDNDTPDCPKTPLHDTRENNPTPQALYLPTCCRAQHTLRPELHGSPARSKQKRSAPQLLTSIMVLSVGVCGAAYPLVSLLLSLSLLNRLTFTRNQVEKGVEASLC
jgi:hypothetical protein